MNINEGSVFGVTGVFYLTGNSLKTKNVYIILFLKKEKIRRKEDNFSLLTLFLNTEELSKSCIYMDIILKGKGDLSLRHFYINHILVPEL